MRKRALIRPRNLVSLIIAAIILIFGTPAFADHDLMEGIDGPAFTDPSEISEMPKEWIAKPIKYDSINSDAEIVVTLDQHLYPSLLPIIKNYAANNKMKISINEGTCGISAGMLSRKEADIGGYCCPPGLTDRLPGLQFHTLGISSLALLKHPDNPVDNVTIEEARKIFTGDIFRWSELKTPTGEEGPNLPVQPIGRLHCKLRPGHWRLLLGNENLFSTTLQEVGAIPDMIYKVATNQRAIGYEVLWNITRYKERGIVTPLKINGHTPYDQEHIISGDYPLYRVYNLTTWEGAGVAHLGAQKLVAHIIQHIEKAGAKNNIISPSRLKQAGWKFRDTQLIGEPDSRQLPNPGQKQ